MEEAKLFSNGQSQAVRLPKKFRFGGKKVYIRRLGEAVILLPYRKPWSVLRDACAKFTEDFMSARDQGIQKREFPFA